MFDKGVLAVLRDVVQKPFETTPLSRLISRIDEVLGTIETMQVADKINAYAGARPRRVAGGPVPV
jgi:hypothetical protein